MTIEEDKVTPEEDDEEAPAGRKPLPVWVVLVAFALLLGFLGMIGWGLKNSQAGPIVVGDKVPSFRVTSFDGQAYNTADLAGKVIFLNFWASWCDPCAVEAPYLEEAWQGLKDKGDVVFLGADYVDTEPQARAFLDKFKVSYPNGPDLRTAVSQMFRIRGVPETYVIGKDGRLKFVKIGPFLSTDEVKQAVNTAMSQ